MTTISISLDDTTRQQLDELATNSRRSRSDIVRDMVSWYQLQATTDAMQQKAIPLLHRLGLETDEQIAAYASGQN